MKLIIETSLNLDNPYNQLTNNAKAIFGKILLHSFGWFFQNYDLSAGARGADSRRPVKHDYSNADTYMYKITQGWSQQVKTSVWTAL